MALEQSKVLWISTSCSGIMNISRAIEANPVEVRLLCVAAVIHREFKNGVLRPPATNYEVPNLECQNLRDTLSFKKMKKRKKKLSVYCGIRTTSNYGNFQKIIVSTRRRISDGDYILLPLSNSV